MMRGESNLVNFNALFLCFVLCFVRLKSRHTYGFSYVWDKFRATSFSRFLREHAL